MGSENHVATKERTVWISKVAVEDNNKKKRTCLPKKAEAEPTEKYSKQGNFSQRAESGSTQRILFTFGVRFYNF